MAEAKTIQLERWLPVPIPGFSEDYEVSDFGRVRRLRDATHPPRFIAGRFLSPCATRQGYLMIRLCGTSEQKSFSVHHLVAIAFLGPVPEGKEINHINGIKSDNRRTNLEFLTRTDNIKHAIRIGLRNYQTTSGEKQWNARLTAADVKRIRLRHGKGESLAAIGRSLGVTSEAIRLIVKRTNWKHVS